MIFYGEGDVLHFLHQELINVTVLPTLASHYLHEGKMKNTSHNSNHNKHEIFFLHYFYALRACLPVW